MYLFCLSTDIPARVPVLPDGAGMGPHTEAARYRRQGRQPQNVSFSLHYTTLYYIIAMSNGAGMERDHNALNVALYLHTFTTVPESTFCVTTNHYNMLC